MNDKEKRNSSSSVRPNAVSRRGFVGSLLAGAALAVGPHEVQAESSPVYDALRDSKPKLPLPTKTLIGNFHALMPGAIAFIKDDATGIVLDIGSDKGGAPGTTAPDFSYSTWTFMADGADLTLEWGRTGREAAVFLIRTSRNVKLLMTLPANPWRPFHHYFSGVDGGVDALALTVEGVYIPWSLRVDPAPNVPTPLFTTRATLEVQITPEHPVRIVAGFGELPAIGSVPATLAAARERYLRDRAQANGDWGDFVAAITDNLNNNRLYSSLTRRTGNVIGRSGWLVSDPDYLPYFTWDSSFNGLLASIEDPDTAKETIRTVLRYQLPSGMVSQLSEWTGGAGGIVNPSCSNPPVTSLCAWKIYQRWADRDFLADIYPRLLRWHDWWPLHSDGNQNGLLEWGSATGGWKQALLATGWDDTPHFDGSRFAGTQMTADAVDLNSLWSLDAETLAKMAAVLGLEQDARRLRHEHEEMNKRINDELWNEELGLYCSRLWSEEGKPGAFLTRIVPLNFYPLICGAPDTRRAARVMAVLTDPERFWGKWMVPTLPYNDPDYAKQEYWKGHVWGPANYLVWHGVQRYGTPLQKAEFARRSVDLFMRNWTARRTCNENYRSDDGTGDDLPHYTWGSLLCQVGIEALYDIDAKGAPVAVQNAMITERLELRNVPAGGKLYSLSCSRGETVIRPAT